MKSIVRVMAFFVVLNSSHAFAWDGVVTGQIDVIQGGMAGNYPFRVVLKNGPVLCGNTNNWAFLLDTDGNYKTNAGILLSAKIAASTVILYTTRDASGYCRIDFFQIQ